MPTAASPLPAAGKISLSDCAALGLDGGELAARRAQDGALVQHGMAAGIGVHDAPGLVDQEHAGAEAVEGIGEGRGLGSLEIDRPADQHRAADVRDDEPHALARLVVDQAVALVAEDAEHGGARRRLVEHGADEVHQPLRPRPLLVEARLEELRRRA